MRWFDASLRRAAPKGHNPFISAHSTASRCPESPHSELLSALRAQQCHADKGRGLMSSGCWEQCDVDFDDGVVGSVDVAFGAVVEMARLTTHGYCRARRWGRISARTVRPMSPTRSTAASMAVSVMMPAALTSRSRALPRA